MSRDLVWLMVVSQVNAGFAIKKLKTPDMHSISAPIVWLLVMLFWDMYRRWSLTSLLKTLLS